MNRNDTWNNRGNTLLRVLLPAAGILAFASAVGGAEVEELEVRVDAPRPLAAAVAELGNRHGIVITYEDPRWIHANDLGFRTHMSCRRGGKVFTNYGGHG